MNLIVIGEPNLIQDIGTRNNALNEILNSYSKFNDSVTYLSSSEYDLDFVVNSVRYISLSNYSKTNRILFFDLIKIRKQVKNLLLSNKNIHVQFRFPSIYALQVYFFVKDLLPTEGVSFYIAGDWEESLTFNYPKHRLVSKLLIGAQNFALRDKVCVFTGQRLLEKYESNVHSGFAFYSTTHQESDVNPIIVDKHNKNGICFIGRLEKLKNYNFFIDLAKSDIGKHYIFHMLGSGPDDGVVKNRLISEKIDNVVLHGHINDRNELNKILENCKYFVLSSYTEGTSKTLPEVMCHSVIPIAFKDVGSNNSILGYNNGYLANINAIDEVLSFINDVDSNRKRYLELLENGKKYALNFNINNQLKEMFLFVYGGYEETVSKNVK